LGLRVCIVEDQHRFILHHQVMEKTTDDQIAVVLVEQTQARFAALKAMSFDKGFHSPGNPTDLKQRLEKWCFPKRAGYPKRTKPANPIRNLSACAVNIRRSNRRSMRWVFMDWINAPIMALTVSSATWLSPSWRAIFNVWGAVLLEQEQQAADRRRGPYKKAA
jgi:IS5 family transposase